MPQKTLQNLICENKMLQKHIRLQPGKQAFFGNRLLPPRIYINKFSQHETFTVAWLRSKIWKALCFTSKCNNFGSKMQL